MTARASRRSAAVAVTGVLLCGVLAGCGGRSDAPAPSGGSALTAAQADRALLTADDLTGTFTSSNQASETGSQVGCLTATDDLVGVDAAVDVSSAFVTARANGASGVLSQIRSDPDPGVLQGALDRFRDAVARCTRVSSTAEDGVAVDLTVTTDDDVSAEAAGQQTNLTATGTLTSGGRTFPYDVRFAASLVRGSLVIVAAYDLGKAASPVVPTLDALDALVVGRLAALS